MLQINSIYLYITSIAVKLKEKVISRKLHCTGFHDQISRTTLQKHTTSHSPVPAPGTALWHISPNRLNCRAGLDEALQRVVRGIKTWVRGATYFTNVVLLNLLDHIVLWSAASSSTLCSGAGDVGGLSKLAHTLLVRIAGMAPKLSEWCYHFSGFVCKSEIGCTTEVRVTRNCLE